MYDMLIDLGFEKVEWGIHENEGLYRSIDNPDIFIYKNHNRYDVLDLEMIGNVRLLGRTDREPGTG